MTNGQKVRALRRELEGVDEDIVISKQLVKDLGEKRKKVIATMQELCTHPEEVLEEWHSSTPGTYLDKSTYTTRVVCSICEALISETTEEGWYG